MEARFVINLVLIHMLAMLCGANISFSQTEKYLLFDQTKDSYINTHDTKFYYKIDGDLFDVNRYNETDTILGIKNLKIFTVKEMRTLARSITDSIIENTKANDPISIKATGLETRNHLFKNIYVLERISNCTYKRTRVWWIDY